MSIMPSPQNIPLPAGNAARHILLIDGYGFVFRAYHSMPTLSRADGMPIGAVYGFTSMLMKLLVDMKASHIAVILDKGRKNFRHDLYADYKANRPPAPEDLVPQFPLIREASAALNLPVIEFEGYEADDIIATYARIAREEGDKVTIVSSDKDLMQLVGEGVTMYDPLKSRMIGVGEVEEKFGVGPDKVLDVLALIGDSSDNIPGVPGIGPKTAAELIHTYGNLDIILERAGEIKQQKRREMLIEHADTARLSRELAALCDTVPVTLSLDELIIRPVQNELLITFLKAQGFKALLSRVGSHYTNGQAVAAVSPSMPKNYTVITNIQALREWVAINVVGKAALRFSYEEPQKPVSMGENDIAAVSLAVDEQTACHIPVIGRVVAQPSLDLFEAPVPEKPGIAFAALYEVLAPILCDPSILKIGCDIKAMLVALAAYVKEPVIIPMDDIMLMSYVADAGLHGHQLAELAVLHLGKEIEEKKRAAHDMAIPPEALMEQAIDIIRLHSLCAERLFSAHLLSIYEMLERPLVPVLAVMEVKGIKVDRERLLTLSEEFSIKISALEKEIHSLAGRTFNIGSPKQLGEILFDEMGIKAMGKTAGGAYGTGAEILDELAANGHVIAEKILEWRQLSKLKSTYTDALVKQINPVTKRIHTHFQMAVTSTGRLSSIHPNLQNIPIRTEEGNKIRSAFIAEKGCTLLSADYSQIELRLLAHMAGIQTLKTAFIAGKDIHAITASQIFNVPQEAVDGVLRRKAKAINFGIIYGISAFGLARQLGIERGEAGRYIQAYFKEYPGIEAFMETTKAYAREHGYVQTLLGRKCYVEGINDKNPARRNFAERAAINAPLQGTAADIIKKAMVQLQKALAASPYKAAVLLQVHDELVLEVPDHEVAQVSALIRKIMEQVVQLDIPLEVSIATGSNWAEL